jgi:uncharacterized protein YbjQ (UPF0145 family)
MVTTAFTLDGFRVIRNLGVVRGITVRSRSVFGTIVVPCSLYRRQHLDLYKLCEHTRAEAFDIMIQHASSWAPTRSSARATMQTK